MASNSRRSPWFLNRSKKWMVPILRLLQSEAAVGGLVEGEVDPSDVTGWPAQHQHRSPSAARCLSVAEKGGGSALGRDCCR